MTDAAQARYLNTPEGDADPSETAEWREAFDALLASQGPERARFMLDEMARLARAQRVGWQPELNTPYVNTIAVDQQPVFPGDLEIEERLGSLMRWNALAMVVKANQAYGELGGHIASYASAADLFEVGNNHFFHGAQTIRELTLGRPGFLPAAQRPRRLRPRLPRRPPDRRRPAALPPRAHLARRFGRRRTSARNRRRQRPGARPVQLPASVPDARFLAVPHRLHGHRPHQLDLPRALHALPLAPPVARTAKAGKCGACSATARWTSPRA